MADITAATGFAEPRKTRAEDHVPKTGLQWLVDAFVLTAILLVTIAIAIGLMDHGELPAMVAFIAGSGLLVTLVAVHVLLRRAQAVQATRAALADLERKLTSQLQRDLSVSDAATPSMPVAPSPSGNLEMPAAASKAEVPPAPTMPPPPPTPTLRGATPPPPLAVPSAPVPSPAPEAAPQPNLDPPPDNDWSLRPSDLKMENAAAAAATPAPQATEPPRLIEPGPQKSADDLAVINSVLARMASDMAAKDPGVRAPSTAPAADVASSDMAPPAPTSAAADAKRDAEPASSSILNSIRTGLFKSQPEKTTAPSSDAASAAADAAAGAAAGAAGFGAETVAHEAHHASAFDRPAARSPAADAVALGTAQVPDAMAPEGDAAALAMALARGGFHDAEPMPAPPAAAAEAPPSPPSALRATQEQAPASTPDVGNALADPQAAVAAIAEALAHERVDVFLEPVKHLETQAVRHYEVTVRLRLDDEQKAERAAYSEAASGTPLLPLIDTMAVAHARRVVWRLVDNCHDGRVMTTISGESLSSEQFQKHFGEMSGDGEVMADRLLLSFPQHDVRLFSHRQGLALAKLQALGFRFALDYVSDLDMDFETLIDDGFIFVRLDADVFLNGLPVANGVIPADDICRHFSAFGLTPIVGHIRDQEQLQRLRACGVTLGQGHMLGGARAVLAHWLAGEGA